MATKKVTSSRDRAARSKSSKAVVRQGQNPQRANRQAASTAKVTKGGEGVGSGTGASRVTTGKGGNALRNALSIVGQARSMLTPAGMAAAVMAPQPLGNATMRGRTMQGPANPDQGLSKAQSFDKAFAAARKAGKSEFTWDGKRYNTKMK